MTLYCQNCGFWIGHLTYFGQPMRKVCERCEVKPESPEVLEAERRANGGVTGAGRNIDWAREETEQQDLAERFT